VEVVGKGKVETLPLHRSTYHAIDLEPGYKFPSGRIYNPSEFELMPLKAYIEANIGNLFIQWSSSSAVAPILFAKMKNGGVRLCVNCRAFNKATVKILYPLPSIPEMPDRVREARIFMKLDLHGTYHLIQIEEGDEDKTAIRQRYGPFKYQVMPFGVTNAPAMFQSYIDHCLQPYIDNFAVCYLDDILIYSRKCKRA